MKNEIAMDLIELSKKMELLANKIITHSDADNCVINAMEWDNHAHELIGASGMAMQWAQAIMAEA